MAEHKQETPGFSKAAEVAALLDVTIQRVGQLKKEGVLKQYKTPAGDRYKLVEAVKDYIHFIRDQQNRKPANQWDEVRAEADAKLRQHKEEMAALELNELKGTMHRSEDVEAITTDFMYAVRSALIAMPGRLAVDLATIKTAPEAAVRIRKETNAILNELANYKYDPEAYKRRVRERAKQQEAQEDEAE